MFVAEDRGEVELVVGHIQTQVARSCNAGRVAGLERTLVRYLEDKRAYSLQMMVRAKEETGLRSIFV